jgi:ribonuclease J
VAGKVDCGYVYVDGLAVGDVGEESLKDRRILGDEGFIAITVVLDSVTGKVTGTPLVSGRGFSDEPAAFENVLPLIAAELERAAADGVVDTHRLAQAVRRVVGRWVSDTYRRRPMIIPTVIEV